MTRLTRRAWLFCGTVYAIEIGAARIPPALAQAANAPSQKVGGLYTALEAAMRAGRGTPFQQRFDTLMPVVDQAFDLETVLKVSVGPLWDGLTDEVRTRLLKAYRRFTVATYVANFDRYDGERFQIMPNPRSAGADCIVATEIINPSGQRFRLDYVMRNDDGNWRAVDILLEGTISRVAVQRSDFRKILANGDANALIVSLHRKMTDLSDGALDS